MREVFNNASLDGEVQFVGGSRYECRVSKCIVNFLLDFGASLADEERGVDLNVVSADDGGDGAAGQVFS